MLGFLTGSGGMEGVEGKNEVFGLVLEKYF
jgi:hypothetical protein